MNMLQNYSHSTFYLGIYLLRFSVSQVQHKQEQNIHPQKVSEDSPRAPPDSLV